MDDDAVVKATGTALSTIAAILERAGIASGQEIANLIGMCGKIASEDGDDNEGVILATWSGMIADSISQTPN